ncbi:HNH endonuclease [Devosia equisanguinis]|uniref:HNH endonuclease n=1 Tax=Devosia equisanguinis TaxID=2490941 RepID=UPI001CB79661|nr:HNH endonuclease [Devosia equisanguinis]
MDSGALGSPQRRGQYGFWGFVHRADSIYEDDPEVKYQFPSMYFSRASKCVGDWVIYYEPTKVRGSKGYYAMAKLEAIMPDPSADGMFLALMVPGTFLEFSSPVPYILEDGIAETGLLNEMGRNSGRAQAAVRGLSGKDFERIISRGLAEPNIILPRIGEAAPPQLQEFDEEQAPFEQDRVRVETLVSHTLRDRVFRRLVLKAYDERCGITGLRLINGGGRAEVEAAHIRPVWANGPDQVLNGVALSGTVHWMFDRGLITLSDSLDIVISRHVNDRAGVEGLINRTGRLVGPLDARNRPHPAFLAWHRENCFKH